jgi:ATP-dependent Clp protease ATP-binding subunit ClpC
MNNEFGERFSKEARDALLKAERIATSLKEEINSDHLLLAITTMRDAKVFPILEHLELTIAKLNTSFGLKMPKDNPKTGQASKEVRELLKQSFSVAFAHRSGELNTVHLLLAIVQGPQFNAYSTLRKSGIDLNLLKKLLFAQLNQEEKKNEEIANKANFNGNQFPFFDFPFSDLMDEQILSGEEKMANSKSKTPTLDLFATNLTAKAKKGELDPVIGREKEIGRIIQVLNRRKKNNPVLIGQPGVGKTAIVEGLAQKINAGQVPNGLVQKRILALDLGLMVAGTKYRGEFEKRIKKVVDEIKADKNVILFIDELHTVMGAGAAEGSIDAANIIKPPLARGELHLIGSTTLDEYRKYIEKDSAFERRLQPITVEEPAPEETVQILEGLKKRYENFHHIKITKDAISAAAEFGQKYIHDRFFPDKAIDLIDEACSAKEIEISATAENQKVNQLKHRLSKITKEKEIAVNNQDFEQASKLKDVEDRLKREINIVNKKPKIHKTIGEITRSDIAKVVSDWTGIPVTELTVAERAKYQELANRMKQSIIGQDEAISELVRAIKRSTAGIRLEDRPIGSFIFLGPTGVGKTETAKILAQTLFGSRDALVKIDMSEFMEKHNVSRLTGAPPGYVGYEEGGKLTESIRRKPYAVVLFDEIEKAHPETYNILLQVLEDGFLTDAQGRKVSFKNTVIIMTSNIGVRELNQKAKIGFKISGRRGEAKNEFLRGFKSAKKKIMVEVRKFFLPEFINRLDKIIIFNPLTAKEVKQIVKIQITEFKKRLEAKDLKLKITDEAINLLASKGFEPQFGARPIRRLITREIEDEISEKMIGGELKAGQTIVVKKLKGTNKLEVEVEKLQLVRT